MPDVSLACVAFLFVGHCPITNYRTLALTILMSDEHLYRAGIYRIKARKQPPSALLLSIAIMLVVAAIGLEFAVAAVRPFPIELTAERWLQDGLRPDSPLRPLMIAEQQLPTAFPLSILVVAGALVLRRWSTAIFFSSSMLIGYTGMDALQKMFSRPRPTADWVQVYQPTGTFSFPSVNVGVSVICAGLLSYLLVRVYRMEPVHTLGQNMVLFGILIILMSLVALSSLAAIVLGAHWPSDVLASWLFGSAYVIAAVLVRRRWLAWRRAAHR